MSVRKTRIVASVGDPGKWQAQYFSPADQLWFDIGDPQAEREAAEARRAPCALGTRVRWGFLGRGGPDLQRLTVGPYETRAAARKAGGPGVEIVAIVSPEQYDEHGHRLYYEQ